MRSALVRGSQHFPLPASRKQPFLLFNAYLSIDGYQHNAGGNLGEFFGLHFVGASAGGIGVVYRNWPRDAYVKSNMKSNVGTTQDWFTRTLHSTARNHLTVRRQSGGVTLRAPIGFKEIDPPLSASVY